MAIATGIAGRPAAGVHAARTDPHESLKADGRAGAARGGVAAAQRARRCGDRGVGRAAAGRRAADAHASSTFSGSSSASNPRGVLTHAADAAARPLSREMLPAPSSTRWWSGWPRCRRCVRFRPRSQYPPMAASSNAVFARACGGTATAGIPTALMTVASTEPTSTRCGVPLRSGRAFIATDTLTTPPVAIVNEAFVDRFLR